MVSEQNRSMMEELHAKIKEQKQLIQRFFVADMREMYVDDSDDFFVDLSG